MEYISAEEFLKQPKEVQKVFIDWWESNVSKGDLFSPICPKGIGVLNGTEQRIDGLIPLFTEGQIRKFIEDKTECKIDTIYDFEKEGYEIRFYETEFYREIIGIYDENTKENNLLQAYWKVSCEIAKEVINQ